MYLGGPGASKFTLGVQEILNLPWGSRSFKVYLRGQGGSTFTLRVWELLSLS